MPPPSNSPVLVLEEFWLDEDFRMPRKAEAPLPDPWEAHPACDEKDSDNRLTNGGSLAEVDRSPPIQERLQPPVSESSAQCGHEEAQDAVACPQADVALPSPGAMAANSFPQPQLDTASPQWRAFMEAIRKGGSDHGSARRPSRPVITNLTTGTPGPAVADEQDDRLLELNLLDANWLDEAGWDEGHWEEADWDEGVGDDLLGFQSAPDAWWEPDEFEDEQQRPDWLWEAEEEPKHRRSARAKAADIVRLLDLHTAARRDGALDVLTTLFEDFQHHATFRALHDLALSDPSFENLRRAIELRSVWADRPDWWRSRNIEGFAPVANGPQALSWKLAHRLAVARCEYDPLYVISEDWLEEWNRLRPGDAGYLRFPEFLAYKASELEASLLFAGLIFSKEDPVYPEPSDDPLVRHQLREVTGVGSDLFRTSWPFDERVLAIRLPPEPANPARPTRSSEAHQPAEELEAKADDQEGPAADTQEESQEDCPVQRSTAIEETPRTLKHFPVRPETISHMEYSRLDRTMTVVDTTGYIRIYEGVPAEVCKRMFACEDISHALQELRASYDVLIKRAN